MQLVTRKGPSLDAHRMTPLGVQVVSMALYNQSQSSSSPTWATASLALLLRTPSKKRGTSPAFRFKALKLGTGLLKSSYVLRLWGLR